MELRVEGIKRWDQSTVSLLRWVAIDIGINFHRIFECTPKVIESRQFIEARRLRSAQRQICVLHLTICSEACKTRPWNCSWYSEVFAGYLTRESRRGKNAKQSGVFINI